MLVEFSDLIFSADANFHKFNLLFNTVHLYNRCNFYINIPEVQDSPLYRSLSSLDKEVINLHFTRQVTGTSIKADLIISHESDEYHFDLDEAIAYFHSPAYIVLENSLNDKYFVSSLIKNFPGKSKKIKLHLENRWISFLNAGGFNNIRNVIQEKLQTFEGMPKASEKYFRCVVLADSDSLFPGDINQSRMDLIEFLEAKGILYHILVKREMENYMPDEIIDSLPGNLDFKRIYRKLTPFQKDYLDLEGWFEKTKFQNYPHGIQGLYDSLTEAEIEFLMRKTIDFANFKSEFPKLFINEAVTQSNLKARVSHQGEHSGELETILEKINTLL